VTQAEMWWWILLPYLSMLTFVVGCIWRWQYDRYGWTSRSTELQERSLLKWGSPIFHYSTFAAIGGHIIGILIPQSFTLMLGIPNDVYETFSGIAGSIAAIGVLIGAAFLVFRRTLVPRVRATTSAVDYAVLILLAIVVLLGIYLTLGVQEIGGGYNYRVTVSPWFRSLFTGSPDVSSIQAAPIMYQVHVTAAWFLYGLWPFSRLVHAFSYPLWYLWRPYIVYRSRKAVRPNEPGTGRRRWRRIAARY